MPTAANPPAAAANVAKRIQQLVEERQRHAEELSRIDQILASVGAALGGTAANGRSQPGKSSSTQVVPTPKPAGPEAKKRRQVGTFPTTGEESVLAFVRARKNATNREIEAHWRGEGRGGLAANTLSKLVAAKKLRRTPLGKGLRGSRYSL